ncbi:MAG: DUF4911 domain-containing protein [Candidatus Dadabacteria bacterium]|nr:MAG: DUF4911 domain-containing protein [Candidatus Dadabacteria bacterium]
MAGVVLDRYTLLRGIEVRRKDVVFVQALFEAYDGAAVVKTLDDNGGVLALVYSRDMEDLVDEIIDSFSSEGILWRNYSNFGERELTALFEYTFM